jgi:hypothetical protein
MILLDFVDAQAQSLFHRAESAAREVSAIARVAIPVIAPSRWCPRCSLIKREAHRAWGTKIYEFAHLYTDAARQPIRNKNARLSEPYEMLTRASADRMSPKCLRNADSSQNNCPTGDTSGLAPAQASLQFCPTALNIHFRTALPGSVGDGDGAIVGTGVGKVVGVVVTARGGAGIVHIL